MEPVAAWQPIVEDVAGTKIDMKTGERSKRKREHPSALIKGNMQLTLSLRIELNS